MAADANVWEATKAGVILIIGAAASAFIKNFVSPDGKSDREFRDEYRAEIDRLQKRFDALDTKLKGVEHDHRVEIDDLHRQLGDLTRSSLYYLTGRAEARALLNTRERLAGEALTAWPDDPH